MDNVLDIAADAFVNNMNDWQKRTVKNGFYFSDLAPEDILINMGITDIIDDEWDDYLRLILNKMDQQGIEYKLMPGYEYLKA